MIKSRDVLLIAVFISSLSCKSWAVGSRGLGNQAIGGYSLGQANAVAAKAEDISTNFFNPAGLAYIKEQNISLGGELLLINISHEDESGVTEKADDQTFFVPNFFAGGPLGESKFSWGMGITSPYGLSTKWKNDSFSKYLATDSELKVVHVNPNTAYRIADNLSVALGVDYVRSDAELNRQVSVAAVNATLPPFVFDPTTPDGSFMQEGDGDGWGYNLALMSKLATKHTVGLTYRSRVSMTLEGDASLSNLSGTMGAVFGGSNYSTSAESVLRLPDSTTLAYAYDITPKFSIEADVEWTGWSTFKEQRVTYTEESDPTRLAILNTGNPQARKWEDVVSFALGSQFALNDKWKIRGGYLFMDSPVPNETYEPAVPDSDLHGISLGTGYSNGNVFFDFGYLANFFQNRTVSNDVGNPLASADGTYKSFAHSIAFNIGFKL